MKLPKASPVMQHLFSVTFNGEPVEGLTEWINDVSLDYIERKIGLSFLLCYDDNPENTLSHQKLVAVLANKEATMEVRIHKPDGDEICKEVFHNLKLVELYHGFNSVVSSSDEQGVLDELDDLDDDEVDTSPHRVNHFANPVCVSASIKFGVTKNG